MSSTIRSSTRSIQRRVLTAPVTRSIPNSVKRSARDNRGFFSWEPVCTSNMRISKLLVIVSLALPALYAQNDWPSYGHDPGGQRYSPLKQINTTNVSKLVPAWSLQMRKEGVPFRLSQSIPLMVNGVLYLGWPYNHVAAIEPETGKTLWEFTGNTKVRTTLGSMRSLAYYPGDKQMSPQILFGTEDGELYSVNAKTGKLHPDFGNEGIVNLKTPEIMNGFTNFRYGITSAPFIYKNLVITGAHVVDETGSKGRAGDVRAWDVRTGKLVWTSHTVPRPGEMGHEVWLGDAWKKMSGANVWSFFSADAARGIISLPLGSVNNDYYGVDRPGPELFPQFLVAPYPETRRGKRCFPPRPQDLPDYRIPGPPLRSAVAVGGER